MDTRFSAPALDSVREFTLGLYPLSTTLAAVTTDAAPAPFDLSPYVASAQQRPGEVTVTLHWHHQLDGATMPQAGQILALWRADLLAWVGLIASLSDYRLAPGEHRLTLTARSRDALPAWRSSRRVTDLYSLGTRLDQIATDVARSVGLEEHEILLPALDYAIPHSNLQLADLTAWDMLETLLLPAGFSPFIDGLGRLCARSRDLTRPADVTLQSEQILAITGARAQSAPTAVRLRWLDPQLTEVAQQDQALASANITAGFFQVRQKQEVYWSQDRTQRAKETRLVIKQSANSGILPVCSEDFRQTAHTGGVIELETAVWVPGLVGTFMLVKAAGAIPDIAPPFGGPTSPVGKMVHAALELSVMLTLASIGTGAYEVWGIPYDYVHGRNTTEAVDAQALPWREAIDSLESDLILHDDHARAVVARELAYRVRAASSYGVNIVDDPRLEPGDIVALPDGTRLYVTGYQRDCSPGSPAVLALEGFQV